MEKQIEYSVCCPQCNGMVNAVVQKTVYGEMPGNLEIVMNDKINVAKCPHCGHSFQVPVSVMYASQIKRYAVWYEPIPDPEIEKTSKIWGQMLGDFYEQAPRIPDWEMFKNTINKFESGELKIHPKEAKKSSSGCLSFIALFIVIVSLTLYIF